MKRTIYVVDRFNRVHKIDSPWTRYGMGIATPEDYEYMEKVFQRFQRLKAYRKAKCLWQSFVISNWIILGLAFIFMIIGNILGGVPSEWFAIVFLILILLMIGCTILSFIRLLHLLNKPQEYPVPPKGMKALKIDRILHFAINLFLLLIIFLTLMC